MVCDVEMVLGQVDVVVRKRDIAARNQYPLEFAILVDEVGTVVGGGHVAGNAIRKGLLVGRLRRHDADERGGLRRELVPWHLPLRE